MNKTGHCPALSENYNMYYLVMVILYGVSFSIRV